MFSHSPIRYKLLLCLTLLFLIVAILAFSGFRGVYAYRQLARTISYRSSELPLTDELTRSVHQLRFTIKRDMHASDLPSAMGREQPYELRDQFRTKLAAVKSSLDHYRERLEHTRSLHKLIGDNHHEWETLSQIERTMQRVDQLTQSDAEWVLGDVPLVTLEHELEQLDHQTSELPRHLQRRMRTFADQVRGEYRTWIILTWISSALATLLLAQLVRWLYIWLVRPFRVLIGGSRRVAAGEFDHRIELTTHDEVAELAAAMNEMTSKFQRIRDDLDRQVAERTQELIRGEQMASVGYLAAGVAHEINNPLASIAWCAESLEFRLHDIILEDDAKPDEEHNAEITVLRKYLRRIQDEAFRCKGITEQLLDFSRLGEVERQPHELRELVGGVIEMAKMGKYRRKHIKLEAEQDVIGAVNPQEFKQVVLNLLTNGLDSIEPGGTVWLRLATEDDLAVLTVRDDGCGMTPDTLKHLFEPFFTRRRDGQGTGLGLSITYRIVSDHGGSISAQSDGPGKGATFRVTFPLAERQAHEQKKEQAA